MVIVMGEISTKYHVDIPEIARKTISDIGYRDGKFGFDCNNCAVITSIDKQFLDIAMEVDKAKEIGAGYKGNVFGFATNETAEYMPLPIILAHKLVKRLAYVRKNNKLTYLGLYGKTQVTVEYDIDITKRIDCIVISTQHIENVSNRKLQHDIINYVIEKTIPKKFIDNNTKILINLIGRFVVGGS